MSTIADKLQELIDSKADMKSAIAEKGVEVEGGLTTYAAAIRKIQQGSGGGGTDIDWSGVRFGGSNRLPISPSELYKCGNLNGMFRFWGSADSLKELPREVVDFDTSFATSLSYCCANNRFTLGSAQRVGQWNVSNVTNIRGCFMDCDGLFWDAVNAGWLNSWNTSKVYYASDCFKNTLSPSISVDDLINGYAWSGLKTIPNWDYSGFYELDIIDGQIGIESIPQINIPNFSDHRFWLLSMGVEIRENADSDGVLHQPSLVRLTDIGGFIGLKASLPNCVNMCPNLTVASLENIIRDIYDWNTNSDNKNKSDFDLVNHTGEVMYLGIGSINLSKLTDEQKAVAIAKGWTLI